MGSSRGKIDCIIDIEYAGRTLRRVELLLRARTPLRIDRASLPYLDAYQLRRKMITPPSSPGVGMARHHWPPGELRPNTKDHYQLNTSYNTVYVGAVRPTGSCSQDIGGETFGQLMQVVARESDDGV